MNSKDKSRLNPRREEIDREHRGVKRREFLRTSALVLLGGYLGFKETKEYLKKSHIGDMLHEVPQHIYPNKTDLEWSYSLDGKTGNVTEHPGKIEGFGYIPKDRPDKYTTLDHVVNLKVRYVSTRYGMMTIPLKTTQANTIIPQLRRSRINDRKGGEPYMNGEYVHEPLERLVTPDDFDFACFQLPEGHNLKPMPYDHAKELHIGQKIFIFSEPALQGLHIRVAHVTDLDGAEENPMESIILDDRYFGFGLSMVPGESSGIAMTEAGDVAGFVSTSFQGIIGYGPKASEYMKHVPKD